jgi:hypothetical protein
MTRYHYRKHSILSPQSPIRSTPTDSPRASGILLEKYERIRGISPDAIGERRRIDFHATCRNHKSAQRRPGKSVTADVLQLRPSRESVCVNHSERCRESHILQGSTSRESFAPIRTVPSSKSRSLPDFADRGRNCSARAELQSLVVQDQTRCRCPMQTGDGSESRHLKCRTVPTGDRIGNGERFQAFAKEEKKLGKFCYLRWSIERHRAQFAAETKGGVTQTGN